MESQDRPYESAESMNKALLALYESRLPEINIEIAKCIDQCGWLSKEDSVVSKLFFMQVDEAYLSAPKKILFVGRETFGWGKPDWDKHSESDQAEELMAFYNTISTNGEQNHYNSPFWWFRRDFSRRMGISNDFKRATLWTNLSKIDVNKTTPTGQHFWYLSQLFINLLVAEIEIVKPDVVLILTKDGHYTWHLDNYGWNDNKPFVDYKEKELRRVPALGQKITHLIAGSRLPEHTYQICHPNVLRRKAGGYKKHADELIEALAGRVKA